MTTTIFERDANGSMQPVAVPRQYAGGQHVDENTPTHFPLAAGEMFTQQINAITPSAGAGGVNRIEYIPIFRTRQQAVDQMSVEVSTVAAGTFCRIGLHASLNGNVGDLLVGGVNSLDCSTLGMKHEPIAHIFMPGVLYWAVVHYSANTFQLRSNPVAGAMVLSAPTTGGAASHHTTRRANGTPAYAGGLPLVAQANSLMAGAVAPLIYFRAS